MAMGSRAAALLCACIFLGGCNIVVSKVPVFTASDSVGAPALKPGLWLAEKDDCKLDEAAPVASWPECADPLVVTPTEIHGVGPKAAKPAPYLVAAALEPMAMTIAPPFPAIIAQLRLGEVDIRRAPAGRTGP